MVDEYHRVTDCSFNPARYCVITGQNAVNKHNTVIHKTGAISSLY